MSELAKGKKRHRMGAMVAMIAAPLALAVVSVASASTVTNQPGSVCKNYQTGDVIYMDYYVNGVRSTKDSATTIVCPMTRPAPGLNQGADIYVDVNHSGTLTTTCTAYSHAAGGRLLASKTASFTGSGYGYVYINLRGALKSDITSDYSVLCTIAGNGKALVSGVHSNEF